MQKINWGFGELTKKKLLDMLILKLKEFLFLNSGIKAKSEIV